MEAYFLPIKNITQKVRGTFKYITTVLNQASMKKLDTSTKTIDTSTRQ